MFFELYRHPPVLAPDSATYLLHAVGVRAASPFNRRLFPLLLHRIIDDQDEELDLADQAAVTDWCHRRCRRALLAWRILTLSSLVFAVGFLAVTVSPLAAVLFAGLPFARQLVRWPWMLDAPAFALALVAPHVPLPYSIALSVLSGCFHERGPVFAALYAGNPLLLAGLAVPFVTSRLVPAGMVRPWEVGIVDYPFLSARKVHQVLSPMTRLVLPWGVLLVGFGDLGWLGWLTVAVAYAQTFVATDRIRLIGWAAPVLLVTATGVLSTLPAWALALAVIAHLVHPWSEAKA